MNELTLSHSDVTRIVRGKMKDNAATIIANAHAIREQADYLLEACKTNSIEEMSDCLRKIVDAAIGGRSRLMFMRGAWSVHVALRNGIPRDEDEGHERLD